MSYVNLSADRAGFPGTEMILMHWISSDCLSVVYPRYSNTPPTNVSLSP